MTALLLTCIGVLASKVNGTFFFLADIYIHTYINIYCIYTYIHVQNHLQIFCICTLLDIGKVGSLSGAVFGSAMMFIFPPIMYIRALQRFPERNSHQASKTQLKILVNVVLLLSGLSLGLLGTYNTVLSILSK